MESTLHVVVGAGQVGRVVAAALARRGETVRIVSRSGTDPGIPGVTPARADVSDPQQAKDVCTGASTVFQIANPPYTAWPEQFPPIQRSLLDAAAAADALYVSAENLYGYGPHDGPLTEDLPLVATGRKGAVRAAMCAEVLEAHRSGRVRTTAGRAADYVGPGAPGSSFGERFFGPLVAGKKAQVLGDPGQLHSVSYVPDVARGLVTLATDERAWGRSWHLPVAPAVTQHELAALAAAAAGTKGGVQTLPTWLAKLAGRFNPMLRELVEMLYEFDRPFVVDDSAFTSTFGWTATPLGEAVATTVAWYRDRSGR